MLIDLGLIILLGLSLSKLALKFKLPALVGLLVAGMILGISGLDIIGGSTYEIAPIFRKMALVVILIRAGLQLDLKQIKATGLTTFLLSFVPALAEIATIILIGGLLGISFQDSFIIGCVLAAVSPAIIVPKMLKILNSGKEEAKPLATMILGGSALDDIVVITLFSIAISLEPSSLLSTLSTIIFTLINGVILGIALGYLLNLIFKVSKLSLNYLVITLLATSFLVVGLEEVVIEYFEYSSLISVMVSTMTISYLNPNLAKEFLSPFTNIWQLAEIFLFVSIGANLDISYTLGLGLLPFIIIGIGLIGRMIATNFVLMTSKLSKQERFLGVVSYLPKATVQAALGGIALEQGLAVGNLVLSIAVLAILISAPLGAFLIDYFTLKVYQIDTK